MSASLVGSEMCIRDRPSAAQGNLACSGSQRRRFVWALDRRRRCKNGWGCLLYTSDAADDM
eukprot:9225972-Alexandrium_andersonii.AAC.1